MVVHMQQGATATDTKPGWNFDTIRIAAHRAGLDTERGPASNRRIAEYIGIAPMTLSDSFRRNNPTMPTAWAMCKAFNLTLNHLIVGQP